MTTGRKLHNWQGTEVPIPQILLLASLKCRCTYRQRAPRHKMRPSGIEVPLGRLLQFFKTGTLWSHQDTRPEWG